MIHTISMVYCFKKKLFWSYERLICMVTDDPFFCRDYIIIFLPNVIDTIQHTPPLRAYNHQAMLFNIREKNLI